jgi:hypothetical protein
VQGLFQNLYEAFVEWDMFFTHDLPIPDCFNALCEAALDGKADAVWFVEEDMEVPHGILDDLLIELSSTDHGVVVADYAVEGHPTTLHYKGETLMASGMGCMLIKREVLEALGEPYFRDTYEYGLPEWTPIHMVPGTGYGRQDIDFGYRINQLGYTIGVLPDKIGHYKIEAVGTPKLNQGVHKVKKL